jgi:hypothetical protein
MGWFEEITGKLFGSTQNAKIKAPFIEEKLVRRGDFVLQMQAWKKERFQNLDNLLSKPILMVLSGMPLLGLIALKQNGVDGVFFNADFKQGKYTTEYAFWSEYAIEVLEKRGYYKYQATRKIFDKQNYVETIERTYLKQKLNREFTMPIEQNWGNITIEVLYKNDIPVGLKIQRNYYSDRNYSKPRDFEELLAIIFNFPLGENEYTDR